MMSESQQVSDGKAPAWPSPPQFPQQPNNLPNSNATRVMSHYFFNDEPIYANTRAVNVSHTDGRFRTASNGSAGQTSDNKLEVVEESESNVDLLGRLLSDSSVGTVVGNPYLLPIPSESDSSQYHVSTSSDCFPDPFVQRPSTLEPAFDADKADERLVSVSDDPTPTEADRRLSTESSNSDSSDEDADAYISINVCGGTLTPEEQHQLTLFGSVPMKSVEEVIKRFEKKKMADVFADVQERLDYQNESVLRKHSNANGDLATSSKNTDRLVFFDGLSIFIYRWMGSPADCLRIPIEQVERIAEIKSADKMSFAVHLTSSKLYVFKAKTTQCEQLWRLKLLSAVFERKQIGEAVHKALTRQVAHMPRIENFLRIAVTDSIHLAKTSKAVEQDAYVFEQNCHLFYWTATHGLQSLNLAICQIKSRNSKGLQCVSPQSTVELNFAGMDVPENSWNEWKRALEDAIKSALSDDRVQQAVYKNKKNRLCADCGIDLPEWASLNFVVCICHQCAAVHRHLEYAGMAPRVRSLRMDINVWTEPLIRLFTKLGNRCNRFWEASLFSPRVDSRRTDDLLTKITPLCTIKDREAFIRRKYCEKALADTRNDRSRDSFAQSLRLALQGPDLLVSYKLLHLSFDLKPALDTQSLMDDSVTGSQRELFVLLMPQRSTSGDGSTAIAAPSSSLSVLKKATVSLSEPTIVKEDTIRGSGRWRSASKLLFSSQRVIASLRPGEFSWQTATKTNVSRSSSVLNLAKNGSLSLQDIVLLGSFSTSGESVPLNGSDESLQDNLPIGKRLLMIYYEQNSSLYFLHMSGFESSSGCSDWMKSFASALQLPICDQILLYSPCRLHSASDESIDDKPCQAVLTATELHLFVAGLSKPLAFNLIALPSAPKATHPSGKRITIDSDVSISFQSNAVCDKWMVRLLFLSRSFDPRELAMLPSTSDNLPLIVDKCLTFVEIQGLQTPGIYRKQGSNSAVQQLLAGFAEDARSMWIDPSRYTEHDVSNALKRFLRELNAPITTFELHDQFCYVSNFQLDPNPDPFDISPDPVDWKIQQYRIMVKQMAPVNFATLRRVLRHLRLVCAQQETNKMSMDNLALIFGPTLMSVDRGTMPSVSTTANPAAFVQGSEVTVNEMNCIRDMMQHYDEVFEVDSAERGSEAKVDAALARMAAAYNTPATSSSESNGLMQIWVKLESLNEEMRVMISYDTVCADILEQAQREHGLQTGFRLFESLGNGELQRPIMEKENIWQLMCVLHQRRNIGDNGTPLSYELTITFDHYLASLEASFAEVSFPYSVNVRYQKSSRGFRKGTLTFSSGTLSLAKVTGTVDETFSINDSLHVFYGVVQKREPTSKWAITIHDCSLQLLTEEDTSAPPAKVRLQQLGIAVCFKDRTDMVRALACYHFARTNERLLAEKEDSDFVNNTTVQMRQRPNRSAPASHRLTQKIRSWMPGRH